MHTHAVKLHSIWLGRSTEWL